MDIRSQSLLAGRKGLVVGIANEHSIAYGCGRVFRSCGAELAVTWLNEKARPHVEPLVVPHYGVMGPVKAALEASVRYLSTEMGPRGIRVNAVSPGPIRTRAASGIPGFDDLVADARSRAPLPREIEIDDVGSLCAFLVSDAARAITGDVHTIDGGLHILA